ncbi:NupC/NupG family nucleoside CNT transporter [Aliiglaciecola sp. 3_MG-2023]|uniref:NupC/NupG family nucleoside CNT transporter n=1 Tax=unclassified Aliiglaciecola TaxID=2593648 RepID=UPI0026E3F6FD|nr:MULTISPECIES: NupC/NupG family nucleoside CNT transporter [unclassified Aliiglaciecola]MDO6692954.1 NupC/NupG family nucleoside CNT transporter [Aliiglaciecola sp. 3_MG-2023]MDO6711994.1 NupC/NupG family nucleoside CNT transporter [Aliiglaciecola sp. 2_MG-2023]MDO6753642.1 NupC/NupG family nucleoside CNT transporter [Aliiglaciecola sp. 1_MG-2023]
MIGLLGIVVLIAIAYGLSAHRKSINWRTVGGAFFIQAIVGALILYVPAGKDALLKMSAGVQWILDMGQAGIDFIFGPLGNKSMGFIFAFNVLPAIVFFSSLIAVLYYIGVMQWVIRLIGGFLQFFLKTSRPESMSAAANIFVGQTEAPLVVKPFIPQMTRSELFAIMVGGLASIAGAVMVGYAQLGVDIKFLLAASFMAAPGGLLMAKIIMPETETYKNELDELQKEDDGYANVFDAAATGAASGLHLALNVGAMLLAFIALIAILNGLIGGIGGWFGQGELSLQMILGYLFQPLAWVLGVPWDEANLAGSFIGQKMVVNEFIAYLDFIKYQEELSLKSQAIITFALCGFANFSSIAILMGGIGALAPTRRKEIARLGLKAVIAATLSNLMSATLAGLFVTL